MKKVNYTSSEIKRVGSAPTVESLQELIKKHLYWSTVIFTESQTRTVGNKVCYDVANGKGIIPHYVMAQRKGRCALFQIEPKEDDNTGK